MKNVNKKSKMKKITQMFLHCLFLHIEDVKCLFRGQVSLINHCQWLGLALKLLQGLIQSRCFP